MDPVYPVASSKPASEEIFGKRICTKPCVLPFCPEPRECWESLQTYKPAFNDPWCFCACPPVKIRMLDEQTNVPYGWPNYSGCATKRLTNLRMSDAYTRIPRDRTVHNVSKYKKDYCRPLEVHIIPHCARCEGPHVCLEPPPQRATGGSPPPHRCPRFQWHDGYATLNYSEKPFPPNPVLSQ